MQNNQNIGHHVIEISEESRGWAAGIKVKLDRASPHSPIESSCCIYKIHEKFRKVNEYAYAPQMISIGPFHHTDGPLSAMNHDKMRYAKALLERTGNEKAKLEECVESISRLEDEARKCYSESFDINKASFVEMMIVDGLFIIELFHQSVGDRTTNRSGHIFDNKWGMSSLVRDMILLENQLPMRVLEELFSITRVSQGGRSLNDLAINFFDPLMPRDENILQKCISKKGRHLLDLLSNTFQVDLPQGQISNNNPELEYGHASNESKALDKNLKHVPCVIKLRKAGVKFQKRSVDSFLEIDFSNGVLKIPHILVQDQTETLLRNLIAFEQCCNGSVTCMTSYAFFMDSLIDSAADVEYLRKKGIITNWLGDDESVANLFNKLCSEVTLIHYDYATTCDRLNAFCKTRWHEWYATLRHDYFGSPWTLVSFLAALLLIILTFLQTIYTIYPKLQHQ